jgi:hypothetical protein
MDSAKLYSILDYIKCSFGTAQGQKVCAGTYDGDILSSNPLLSGQHTLPSREAIPPSWKDPEHKVLKSIVPLPRTDSLRPSRRCIKNVCLLRKVQSGSEFLSLNLFASLCGQLQQPRSQGYPFQMAT